MVGHTGTHCGPFFNLHVMTYIALHSTLGECASYSLAIIWLFLAAEYCKYSFIFRFRKLVLPPSYRKLDDTQPCSFMTIKKNTKDDGHRNRNYE